MNTKHIHHFMCSAAATLLLASFAAGSLQDVQRLDKIISDLTRLRCREASCIEAQSKLLTLLQALRRDMPNDASVRLTGDGRTALHFAAILGSRQSVEWLLANYAVQWYTDPYGTPFMCTTDDDGPAIRKLLVQQSAFGVRGRPSFSPLPDADRRELEAILSKLYALRCRDRAGRGLKRSPHQVLTGERYSFVLFARFV